MRNKFDKIEKKLNKFSSNIHNVLNEIRDKNINIGVLAQNSYPMKTNKSKGVGEKNVSIKLGSILINPGDWIYVDSNGWIKSEKKLEL